MRNWLRVIAALEVVGGAFGFGFIVLALLTNPVNGLSALLAVFVLGVNALSFVAGIALWNGSRAGRILSVVVQVIQLPKVVSQSIIFMFSFGLDAWVFASQSAGQMTLGFHFNLLSANQIFFNAPVESFSLVGVSISSIAFLAVLIRSQKETPAGPDEPPLPPPPPDWHQPSEGRPNDRFS